MPSHEILEEQKPNITIWPADWVPNSGMTWPASALADLMVASQGCCRTGGETFSWRRASKPFPSRQLDRVLVRLEKKDRDNQRERRRTGSHCNPVTGKCEKKLVIFGLTNLILGSTSPIDHSCRYRIIKIKSPKVSQKMANQSKKIAGNR